MPKNNDKSIEFDSTLLNQAIRRVALMADERSHAIRFHLEPNQLIISSQNAEEGEARETIQADYTGEEADIGFNAQYLQDFLNVMGDGKVAFEFKDGNSQAQLRPSEGGDFEYKYVVMPMRNISVGLIGSLKSALPSRLEGAFLFVRPIWISSVRVLILHMLESIHDPRVY